MAKKEVLFSPEGVVKEALRPIKPIAKAILSLGKVKLVERGVAEDVSPEEASHTPWVYLVYQTLRHLRKPKAPRF